jgi:hypothetical protein
MNQEGIISKLVSGEAEGQHGPSERTLRQRGLLEQQTGGIESSTSANFIRPYPEQRRLPKKWQLESSYALCVY